jgi:hypothetical protein
MTDFSELLVADRGQKATPIYLVDKSSFEDWAKSRPAEDRALLKAHRFDGKSGFSFVILPRGDDSFEVVSAVADATELSPWCLARLGESLPDGTYRLASGEPGPAALGWLLAQHRLDDYRKPKDDPRGPRVLVTGEPARIEPSIREAERPPSSATSSTSLPPTLVPRSSRRPFAISPPNSEATSALPPVTNSPPAIRLSPRSAPQRSANAPRG